MLFMMFYIAYCIVGTIMTLIACAAASYDITARKYEVFKLTTTRKDLMYITLVGITVWPILVGFVLPIAIISIINWKIQHSEWWNEELEIFDKKD